MDCTCFKRSYIKLQQNCVQNDLSRITRFSIFTSSNQNREALVILDKLFWTVILLKNHNSLYKLYFKTSSSTRMWYIVNGQVNPRALNM